MGSPSYMAPEQAEGKTKQVGPLADVYALGAILYELLTGRPPFRGTTALETLEQVKNAEPVPPSRLVPGLPRDVETIALKCLQKEPEKRYDSAAALAEDLRRFLGGEPIVARPVPFWERAWRWCRRNPLVAGSLAGVAGIFLTAFVLVSWSFWRAEDALEERGETASGRRHRPRRGSDRPRRGSAQGKGGTLGALPIEHRRGVRRLAVAKQHHRPHALEAAPQEHRNWEWQHIHSQLDGARHVWPVPGGRVDWARAQPVGPADRGEMPCSQRRVPVRRVRREARGRSPRSLGSGYIGGLPPRRQAGRYRRQRRDHPPLGPGDGPRTGPAQGRRTAPHAVVQPRRQPDCVARAGGKSRLWDSTTGKEIAVLGEVAVGPRMRWSSAPIASRWP